MICRLDGPLYYGNSELLIGEVLLLIGGASSLHWLVLRFDSVGDVDWVGANMLMELSDRLQRRGAALVFAELSTKVRSILSDFGVFATIGSVKEFSSVRAARSAYRRYESVSRNRFAEPRRA